MAADVIKTMKSGVHIIMIVGVMLSVLLIADTRIQAKTWQNSTTLFEHALDVIDDNYLAHNNLAVVLFKEGRIDQSCEHLREAIRIKPNYTVAHYNLGVSFYAAKQWDKAEFQFKEAIRLNPSYANAYLGLEKISKINIRKPS
jgi:tetratricopeptide (TPR) repeat protein